VDDALARWLALREPTDVASRSERLMRTIAERLSAHDPVRVLDLGTGTGSNIRFMSEYLHARHQQWLAVDRSELLLRRARTVAGTDPDRHVEVETRQADLGALDDTSLFAGRHLVTASALLDLVSESWLRTLAARCRHVGAAALFTIVYDGRTVCSPGEPEDALVLELFNRHQHRDKGLGGPAAGPDATEAAIRAFSDTGYHVDSDRSDWTLDASDADLQRELIAGWAFAAKETDPSAAPVIDGWLARRLAHVDADRSEVVVGHEDVAAWLGGR
jgi:SAM-dependent methyltransferase